MYVASSQRVPDVLVSPDFANMDELSNYREKDDLLPNDGPRGVGAVEKRPDDLLSCGLRFLAGRALPRG